jgi:hypothetical protein
MNQVDDLQQLQDSAHGTNRPPHHDSTMLSADRSTSSWSQRLKHDVTIHNITELGSLNRIRSSLQQAASISSQDLTPLDRNTPHHRLHTTATEYSSTTPAPQLSTAGPSHTIQTDVSSSSFSTTSSLQNIVRKSSHKRGHPSGAMQSPPRIIPFAPSPRSLINTPTREAARIITDNTFQAAGIRSSEDDDDSMELSEELAHKRPKLKGKQPADQPWDATNIMGTDDVESRARFDSFLKARQSHRDEFPSWAGSIKSPSNRHMRDQTPLASTPTTNRVLDQKQMKLPTDMKDAQPLQEETSSSLQLQSPEGFLLPSTPYRQNTEEPSDQEGIGAYEFSDQLENQSNDRFASYLAKEKQSPLTEEMTFGSGSNMTMISGYTGQIPARFDLKYFPSRFRTPPGSSQLTRVYNFFAERPGAMLTRQDFLNYADSSEYSESRVKILIDVLVIKRFLKQVGDKEAWTIRR